MYQYILVAIPPLDLFFNIKDIVNESFRIPDKFTLTLSYQAISLSSKDEHISPNRGEGNNPISIYFQ